MRPDLKACRLPYRRCKSLGNILQPDHFRLYFGGAPRFPVSKLRVDTPGPKYHVGSQPSTPSYGMGRRLDVSRPKSADAWKSPGPGAYTLKDTLKKNGTSLRGNTVREMPKSRWDICPDPGNISEADPHRGPKYSFGARVRPTSAPPTYNSAPMGPISTLTNGSTRFGPPPKNKTQKEQKAPGPGEYILPSSFRYDVGPKFGQKLTAPTRPSSAPGPGTYPIRSTLGAYRSPSYSIYCKRNARSQSKIGPAPYNIPSGVRYDIGRQFGRKVNVPNVALEVPGPGHYQVRSTLGMYRSPKYSMQRRRTETQKTIGSSQKYFLPTTFSGPHYSFGRPRANKSHVTRVKSACVTSEPYDPDWDAGDYPHIVRDWAPSAPGPWVEATTPTL